MDINIFISTSVAILDQYVIGSFNEKNVNRKRIKIYITGSRIVWDYRISENNLM